MRKIFERLVTMRGSPRQREVSLFNSLCVLLRETHERVTLNMTRSKALSLSLRVLEKNTDKASARPRELVSFPCFFFVFLHFFDRCGIINFVAGSRVRPTFRQRSVSFNHCQLLLYLSQPLLNAAMIPACSSFSRVVNSFRIVRATGKFFTHRVQILVEERWWFQRLENYLVVSCRYIDLNILTFCIAWPCSLFLLENDDDDS